MISGVNHVIPLPWSAAGHPGNWKPSTVHGQLLFECGFSINVSVIVTWTALCVVELIIPTWMEGFKYESIGSINKARTRCSRKGVNGIYSDSNKEGLTPGANQELLRNNQHYTPKNPMKIREFTQNSESCGGPPTWVPRNKPSLTQSRHDPTTTMLKPLEATSGQAPSNRCNVEPRKPVVQLCEAAYSYPVQCWKPIQPASKQREIRPNWYAGRSILRHPAT